MPPPPRPLLAGQEEKGKGEKILLPLPLFWLCAAQRIDCTKRLGKVFFALRSLIAGFEATPSNDSSKGREHACKKKFSSSCLGRKAHFLSIYPRLPILGLLGQGKVSRRRIFPYFLPIIFVVFLFQKDRFAHEFPFFSAVAKFIVN